MGIDSAFKVGVGRNDKPVTTHSPQPCWMLSQRSRMSAQGFSGFLPCIVEDQIESNLTYVGESRAKASRRLADERLVPDTHSVTKANRLHFESFKHMGITGYARNHQEGG